MNIRSTYTVTILALLLVVMSNTSYAQQKSTLQGRWNLVIDQEGKELPSWLEIRKSGNKTLVGRFVYASGSARPIAEVIVNEGGFSFAIPPQWEEGEDYLKFSGKLGGDILKGSMLITNGKTYEWEGKRAPELPYNNTPEWGEPIALFNGKDLSGWKAMGTNQWVVEQGMLKSPKSGSNLVSEQLFTDFKLRVEFRYPEGSNSGIYLRGRYEIQIADNHGMAPSDILFGGVYGFLTPNQMAAKKAGEWQAYDITLNGRRVSVIANDIPVITDQLIPGITGGALDSNEAAPGPILIQGDHGPVEFRNITITPILE